MRYTFVLNVSLCVGFASGFIAPAGVPKATEKNYTFKSNEKYMLSEINSRGHHLDEKLLQEHATEKENNFNTRSSIFFSQGYVAPMREIYDVKRNKISPNNKHNPVQSSLTDLQIAHYEELPYKFLAGYPQNTIKESNIPNKAPGNSKIKRKNNNLLVNSLHVKTFNNKGHFQSNEKEVQKHYLNPSIIKSKIYNHEISHLNKNYLSNNQNTKDSKYCDKTQKNPQILLQSNIVQKPVTKFLDIARINLLQKLTHGNNRFNSNLKDFNLNGELNNEVMHSRLAANKIGESNLRPNQKESSREKFVNKEGCNPLDCIKRAGKQYDNKKYNCDCKNKKDRLSREGLNFNESDFTDLPKYDKYDEIKVEDSTDKTINEELLNSIKKLNDTLEMYQESF